MAGRSYYDAGFGRYYVAGVPIQVNSSFNAGSMSGAYNAGAVDHGNAVTGVKVASDFYVTFAGLATGKILGVGNDGSTTNTFSDATGCTGPSAAARKIRQAFAHNAINGLVAIYDGSANTYLCSQKKAGGAGLAQTVTSVDVRTGASWNPTGSALRPFLWSTAGSAYKGNALDPTSFATDTTYDIGSTPLGGGTVRAVVNGAEWPNGIDMDSDGSATDNPIAFLSTNVAWWGTIPSSGSASAAPKPKRSRNGPFNSLPFTLP